MARMVGTGAMSFVALSNVSGAMPWARASTRICARKASNLASPGLGVGGGTGAGWTAGAGGGAGTGFGTVVAQAARPKAAIRARVRVERRIAMPLDTPVRWIFGGKAGFWAGRRASRPGWPGLTGGVISRVDRG